MSTPEVLFVLAVGAFGFVCLLALVFLGACALAKRADELTENAFTEARRLACEERGYPAYGTLADFRGLVVRRKHGAR